MRHRLAAAVIPEADLMVVIRRAAGTPPSLVAGALDRPAICTIIGTPTRATLTPGMEPVAPGTETLTPGMEPVAPGTETVAPGMETVTGTDMAKTADTIIVFPSVSFRIGIQDGGTMITGILIIRITLMTIPIITTRTITTRTTATLAKTDQRASKR
jgi:hypothetical protein